MADESPNENEVIEITEPEVTGKPGFFNRITAGSKEEVQSRKEEPFHAVAKAMADKVIADRTTIVRDAYDLVSDLRRSAGRVRPNSPGVDADGNKLPAVYSNEDFKRKTDIERAISDIDNAMDKAATEATTETFDKVKSLVNKHKGLVGNNKDNK